MVEYWLKYVAVRMNTAVFDWSLQVMVLLVIFALSVTWPRALTYGS
jgi:hypothetical protein